MIAKARVALGFGGVVFALAILELALRVLQITGDSADANGRTFGRLEAPEHVRVLTRVVELASPNASGYFNGAPFSTNRLGFRGVDMDSKKPRGVRRILIIGDSLTMGSGVANDAPYPLGLARMMPEHVQVANLGLAGITAAIAANRLEHYVKRVGLDPDLIVYGWTPNDIEGLAYERELPADVTTFHRTRSLFSESRFLFLRRGWPRAHSLYTAFTRPPGSYEHEILANYLHDTDAWRDFARALDHFAAIGREVGACVVVFLHPVLGHIGPQHPFHPMYDAVVEAARERGMQPIIGYDAIEREDAESLWVRPDDSHPNVPAHRLFAATLYRHLLTLPERCLSPLGGREQLSASPTQRTTFPSHDFVERWALACSNHDMDSFAELYAEQGSFMVAPMIYPVASRDALGQQLARIWHRIPDSRVTRIDDVVGDEDQLAIRWVISFTSGLTHKPARFVGASFMTLQRGKIVRERSVFHRQDPAPGFE